MALRANYQGIKKVKVPLSLTTEGTLSSDTSVIAPTESGTKAGQAYEAGDELYLTDGILYVVTSPIAKDATFIIKPDENYNLEPAGSITSQIKDIKEDIDDLEKEKADITAIGTVESGRTTASRNYSSGEYFYKDGQNCRTKSTVLSGETWTLNTNYESASIDEAISIYEGTITPSTGITLHARTKLIKQGKIVILNALFQGVSCNAETDFNLGNIASEYRPTYVVNGVGLASDGSAMARIQISGNGNIILYSASAISDKSIGLNLSYVLI